MSVELTFFFISFSISILMFRRNDKMNASATPPQGRSQGRSQGRLQGHIYAHTREGGQKDNESKVF